MTRSDAAPDCSPRKRRGGLKSAATLLSLALLSACAAVPMPGPLPIIERPATSDVDPPYFAIFLTGDGGWRKIDIKVSDALRRSGVPVVGLLSNYYFAKERTPEETTAAIDSLIREYSAKWNRPQVILTGYSRGADALPMVINRLPAESRKRIAAVALLGPAPTGGLSLTGPDRYPLAPELAGFRDLPLICVYGTREKESLCRSIESSQATVIPIAGGHHFGGDYERVARAILDALKTTR